MERAKQLHLPIEINVLCCLLSLIKLLFHARKDAEVYANKFNHKNYNFFNCDWFKKIPIFHQFTCLLSISLLSESFLSDSFLSDSSTNQSTNNI